MSEIRVKPSELAAKLKETGEAVKHAQLEACREAANRLLGHMVAQSDELGITYSGVWKNSNKVQHDSDSSVVYNDAPHSGIVEEGCRPHYVPVAVIEQELADWAKRKLGLDDKEARSAAWGIANKIADKGIEGRFPYRNAQPYAKKFYEEALARRLHELP